MTAFLHGLCSDGSPDEVRAALVKGGKVNQRDAYGNTALMMAASFGNEEVVELLLQQPRLNVNLTKKEDKVFGGHCLLSGLVWGCQEAAGPSLSNLS